jgi:hypothetical protein
MNHQMHLLELMSCCAKVDAKFVAALAQIVIGIDELSKSSFKGMKNTQKIDPVKYITSLKVS